MHKEDLSSSLLRYPLYTVPSAGTASDEMVWNGLKTIVKGKQVQCYHNHQEGGGEGVKICQPLGNISTTHHHPLYQHKTRKCGDILILKGPSHQIRIVYESTIRILYEITYIVDKSLPQNKSLK